MSSLTLVRHGQATAFQRDGHLTALGETQARKLAEFWLRHGIGFEEVYSGTLARQVETEQAVAACYRSAGVRWSEATRDAAWNEYDASGIATAPVAPFGTEEYRRFQLMFQAAMLRWLEGSAPANDAEPFGAFRDRVSGAIRRVMAGPSGRRVAVFTSGGPIGLAVNFAVRGPDRSFLELNWRIRNASLTEFVFSQERINLDGFNHVAHLEDVGLRTYR